MIGNGLLLTKHAQVLVTGTSGNIPTADFCVFNKVNFSNLNFLPEMDGLLSFDEDSGIFTFVDSGLLQIDATINVEASQASAEFQIIPEFNFGAGWVRGLPRKKVLTAIKPDQITLHGSRYFPKGSQLRFNVIAISGNVIFLSEILDPGGILEIILPAVIITFELDKITMGAIE